MDKKLIVSVKLWFHFMSYVPSAKITDHLESQNDLSDSEKKIIVNSVSLRQKHILLMSIFIYSTSIFFTYLLENILKINLYLAIFMSIFFVTMVTNFYRNILLLKLITKEEKLDDWNNL
jgi:hypothetical protein